MAAGSGVDESCFRQVLADRFDLGFARLHEGQTDNRVGQDSLPLKNLLRSNSTLDMGHHCTDHWVQFEMYGAGGGKIACKCGIDHRTELLGGHVCRDTDES